jgi:subtilisin-like proprotein convertase family protein
LDILLVSPTGTKIMLMSDAGSAYAVTNATLVFHPRWQSGPPYRYAFPPEQSFIPSNATIDYVTANYGEQETQMLDAPAGPYSDDLNDAAGTNPNGVWMLYIYDDKAGDTGVLQGSWSLRFYYSP